MGPKPTLSPPTAVPKALPPSEKAISLALPPGAATAVPVASPPPMAIVMSLTLLPPVAVPVALPPPMATVRLPAVPPLTFTVPDALHPRPMETVKLSFGPLPCPCAV